MTWWSRAALNTPWNPSRLPLRMWLDGNSVTMYDATKISAYVSLFGPSPAQDTSANMPTQVVASADFGGRNAIRFAATQVLTAAIALASPFTVIAAIKMPGVFTATNRYWLSTDTALQAPNYVGTDDKHHLYNTTPGLLVNGNTRTDAAVVLSNRWGIDTGNGTQRSSQNIATRVNKFSGVAGAYSLTSLTVGGAVNKTLSMLGDVAMIVVCDGLLDDATEIQAMRWMADACKITVTA